MIILSGPLDRGVTFLFSILQCQNYNLQAIVCVGQTIPHFKLEMRKVKLINTYLLGVSKLSQASDTKLITKCHNDYVEAGRTGGTPC